MAGVEKLPTDQYFIRNEDDFAGRNRSEDKSLNPKPVYCPSDGGQELWELKALPNGRYILEARGVPTGSLNEHLFAFLTREHKAEEWVITFRNLDERNRAQYTIETADRDAGWIAEKGSFRPQIAVRRLIVGPSEPPFFSPSELWNIQPLVG